MCDSHLGVELVVRKYYCAMFDVMSFIAIISRPPLDAFYKSIKPAKCNLGISSSMIDFSLYHHLEHTNNID